jgi:polar amino acid transport system substrate-binding protein
LKRQAIEAMELQKLWRLSLAIAVVASIVVFSSSVLAADLTEIVRRGKLVVAVKDNSRPLGFYDRRGNLQGFEIDIAKRLAEELLGSSDAAILKPVSNQERLQVILDNKVDIAIARVTNVSARSRLVDFSHFYYLDGTGLVSKKSSWQQLSNFATAKIVVLNNSSTIAVIRSELPKAQLIGVNSYQEALAMLEASKADAFAADNSLIAGWVQEYPQYKQIPVRLSSEALCVAIPKGLQYQELRDRIDRAISRWHKSGWLRERANYWGLP